MAFSSASESSRLRRRRRGVRDEEGGRRGNICMYICNIYIQRVKRRAKGVFAVGAGVFAVAPLLHTG